MSRFIRTVKMLLYKINISIGISGRYDTSGEFAYIPKRFSLRPAIVDQSAKD